MAALMAGTNSLRSYKLEENASFGHMLPGSHAANAAPEDRCRQHESSRCSISALMNEAGLNAKIFKCYFDLTKKKEVKRKGGLYLSSKNASDVLYEIPFEFSMPAGPDEVGKEDGRIDVVQYWEGSRVPKEIIFFKEKLEKLGFEHALFNKEMAREFIGKTYSKDVLKLFDMAWHPAMESDIFRVLYCALNSSVYLDADWQLKDSGSLFFPIGAADVWFRLLYRNYRATIKMRVTRQSR